jgi:hypothetical protein
VRQQAWQARFIGQRRQVFVHQVWHQAPELVARVYER